MYSSFSLSTDGFAFFGFFGLAKARSTVRLLIPAFAAFLITAAYANP